MCARRARQHRGGGAVREHRIAHERGKVVARAHHHHAELLVGEILLGARDRDAPLDVRLDDGHGVRHRVHVGERDV